MSMPEINSEQISREASVEDIIKSVAMEQRALSHILNAEGEKLQHFLNTAADSGALLEINKSANRLVNAVTRFEVILEEKLNMFSKYISNRQTEK